MENVKIITNMWIPPFSLQKPWCTSFMMAPEGSPLLYYYKKGWIRTQGGQGCDWSLVKSKASGKVEPEMPDMLPDTR